MKTFIALVVGFSLFVPYSCNDADSNPGTSQKNVADSTTTNKTEDAAQPPKITANEIDTAAYNKKMLDMANGDTTGNWPVKGPYPAAGAILPFKRVVAYYGNLYSKQMGILGELPKKQMLDKLQSEVEKWNKADPQTPAIPALHYIAVTAQSAPGKDGKYRLRMPFSQIDTVLNWAKEINALTFVDIQVGHSNIKTEAAEFMEYYKLPNFHLGIDPEFSMKGGQKPGAAIGSFNADDINGVIDMLADVVMQHNLPPKILVIHRFTNDMVMNYQQIKKVPEVQVVIDMDGWGGKELKAGTWKRYIYEQPVQFAGFKIFYKNDLKRGTGGLYTPAELVKFTPKPMYIQYQ